jgi:hypothetical protein
MKRVLLSVVLAATAFGAVAQDGASSVEVRGSQMQAPERAYPVFVEQVDAYKGVYDMSNGQKMTVSRQGRHLMLAIGEQPVKKMVALSDAEFVAADQQLRVRFEGESFNMRGEVRMLMPRQIGSTGSTGSGELVRLVATR